MMRRNSCEFRYVAGKVTMTRVGIVGSGIMGSGIAQVAATHGCTVELADATPDIVERALAEIGKRLDRLVEKSQLTRTARDDMRGRLLPATGPDSLAGCELVIEAVSENLDVKTKVLRPIAAVAGTDRKSTRLNSSHIPLSRMP